MKHQVIFALIVSFLSFQAKGAHDLDFMKFSRESGLDIARRNLETASQNIAGKIKEYQLISGHKPQGRFLSISGVGFFEIPQVDGTLAYARRYPLGGNFKEKLYSFTIIDAYKNVMELTNTVEDVR